MHTLNSDKRDRTLYIPVPLAYKKTTWKKKPHENPPVFLEQEKTDVAKITKDNSIFELSRRISTAFSVWARDTDTGPVVKSAKLQLSLKDV